ncbi:MAG: hypothetical protein ACK442_05820 [Novosphingobium sp.]|jgi:hypothetical protein|nr:hypothetical protein [Brevundimonas sp.]MCZ8320429.1 hypothetical protein [Novosphingobium sp.]
MLRPLTITALALALAACGGDRKDEGAGKAEGQILPGSASDAMLPLDTVRSQAPVAPKTEGGPKDAAEQDETSEAAEAGETAAIPGTAAEAPAAATED